MSREIKFRGKDIVSNEWIYGSLVGESCIIEYTEDSDIGLMFDEQLGYCLRSVIPETIGQYTGLNDKNGNDIYEGDIVTETFHGSNKPVETRESIVKWDSCNPCFVLNRIDNKYTFSDLEYDFVCCDLRKLEVKENIHDNPIKQ